LGNRHGVGRCSSSPPHSRSRTPLGSIHRGHGDRMGAVPVSGTGAGTENTALPLLIPTSPAIPTSPLFGASNNSPCLCVSVVQMQPEDAPRVRADLRIADAPGGAVTVHDPSSGRYFRLRAVEAFLLGRMDGRRALAE